MSYLFYFIFYFIFVKKMARERWAQREVLQSNHKPFDNRITTHIATTVELHSTRSYVTKVERRDGWESLQSAKKPHLTSCF